MKVTSIFDFHANEDILERALSGVVFKKIKRMYKTGKIDIDDQLWCKIIFDVLYAYDRTDLNAGLIEAIKPLYFGRFISFFKSTLDKPFKDCEDEIIEQAKLFWEDRRYLISKYHK